MLPIRWTRVPRNLYAGWNVVSHSPSCFGYPYPPYIPPLYPPEGSNGSGNGDEPEEGQITPVPEDEPATPPPDSLGFEGEGAGSVTPPEDPFGVQTPTGPSVTPPSPPLPFRGSNPGWIYGRESDEGYPWTDTRLHLKNYPTPGMFLDINNPQGRFVFRDPEQLYRAYLGSVLRMAGMDPSLATSRSGAPWRKQLSDLTTCSQYNDGLFGTTSVGLAGGRQWIGPHGRGINWDARHAPIHLLITRSAGLYRTTKLDGQRLPEYMEENHRPVLWLPAIDLEVFAEERRLVPAKWSDGRSAIDPHHSFRIDLSGVRFPGGVGCADRRTGGSAKDWWERG